MTKRRGKVAIEFTDLQLEAVRKQALRENLKVATMVRRITLAHVAKQDLKELRQAAAASTA